VSFLPVYPRGRNTCAQASELNNLAGAVNGASP
jgi:hypothetical protein